MNMDNLLYFFFVLWALIGLIGVRVEMAFRMRRRAIDMTHAASIQKIRMGSHDVDQHWKPYEDGPSYGRLVYDLRIWTFNQAYPNFEERVKGCIGTAPARPSSRCIESRGGGKKMNDIAKSRESDLYHMGEECSRAAHEENDLTSLNIRLDAIERQFNMPIDRKFREYVVDFFSRRQIR